MKLAHFLIVCLFCSFPVAAQESDANSCYSNGWNKDKYLALKSKGFEASNEVISALSEQLIHCLANPDADVRDGVAYEAFATWLRAGKINHEPLSALFITMSTALKEGHADKDGVYLPFVALVYSEVVRVDRISPYLDETQRQKAVDTISHYLSTIEDYRGFEDGIGWRHGVAHASDVVLQLALNSEITAEQLKKLARALASQINADGEHFYAFGEPERLARAAAYLMLRDEIDLSHWEAWLQEASSPAPFAAWGDVFMSEAGLAKRNNVRQFLTNLYAMIAGSKNERLSQITPIVAEMIGKTG